MTIQRVCNRCGREMEHLETYIRLHAIAICEDCYMEMPIREFIETLGGEFAVVC